MGRAAYRVEVDFPRWGKPRWFLVKEVRVSNRRTKVKKYLGTELLTAAQKARASSRYAAEMELRAASRKADLSLEVYHADYLSPETLRDVERVRSMFNSVMGFLTTDEVEAYEKQFELRYIQGTTSIEGNTLTRTQASDLLLHDMAPQGKSLREINEVQNFREVIAYRNAYKRKVTVDFVRNLHNLVMSHIDAETLGVLRRRDDLGINGCDLPVTPSSLIESELRSLIDDYYRGLESGRHPFEQAIVFHYRFEMIHPFTDGNGRVGREILNYMLMRTRYPRLLFLGEDRARYIGALKQGNLEDFERMVNIFAELIIEQRLKILEQKLREAAPGVKRVGQTRLEEFVVA